MVGASGAINMSLLWSESNYVDLAPEEQHVYSLSLNSERAP